MSLTRKEKPRLLIIRYEGYPFAVRMSKVIRTILDSGWDCDILIRKGTLGKINVSKEMGRDLTKEVAIHEFENVKSYRDRLLQKLKGPENLHNPVFVRTLIQQLKEVSYDAVLVKDTHSLGQVFKALKEGGFNNLPVISDMYENASEQWYDYFIRHGSLKSRFLTTIRFVIQRIKKIEAEYLPKCDHIFVVVEEAKEYLLNHYLLDPTRISVVHNVEILNEFDSIEASDFFPSSFEKVLISYVGSINHHRGINLLLDAIEILKKDCSQSFMVAIVGAYEKERERLEKKCKEKGIYDIVNVIGYTPHRSAMQWIKKTDIGVIPHIDSSFTRTTIPNKLFQYMAAGAMCVVSNVGPLGRIVRETGCGITFEPGSSESLAEQLMEALKDRRNRISMGAKGRLAAENIYKWEIEGENYRNYFRYFKEGQTKTRRDLPLITTSK
jgi:glycosyltransferase involved in cell wall biosynthesis